MRSACMPASHVERHMYRRPVPVLFRDDGSTGTLVQFRPPGARRISPLLIFRKRWRPGGCPHGHGRTGG